MCKHRVGGSKRPAKERLIDRINRRLHQVNSRDEQKLSEYVERMTRRAIDEEDYEERRIRADFKLDEIMKYAAANDMIGSSYDLKRNSIERYIGESETARRKLAEYSLRMSEPSESDEDLELLPAELVRELVSMQRQLDELVHKQTLTPEEESRLADIKRMYGYWQIRRERYVEDLRRQKQMRDRYIEMSRARSNILMSAVPRDPQLTQQEIEQATHEKEDAKASEQKPRESLCRQERSAPPSRDSEQDFPLHYRLRPDAFERRRTPEDEQEFERAINGPTVFDAIALQDLSTGDSISEMAASMRGSLDRVVDMRRREQNAGEFDKLSEYVDAHLNDETFLQVVKKLMVRHKISKRSTIYHNAKMSRQTFSKETLRLKREGRIDRMFVWRVAFGLRCTLREADELLFSVGYFRLNNRTDLTLAYCLEHKIYDMFAVNHYLMKMGGETFEINVAYREDFATG